MLDAEILQALQGTGFEKIAQLTSTCKLNKSLVEALLLKFNKEEDGIVLNELTTIHITLEDVYFVLGIPIDGEAIIHKIKNEEETILRIWGREISNDEDKIGTYAWRAAVLAHLMFSIKRWIKDRRDTLSRCTFLLEVIFLERLSQLPTMMNIRNFEQQPLPFVYWVVKAFLE
ncbi:uncharacterized protein LOC131172054 [Hevea brasiliensis]|uniref:uncharacterized protein LOC131172054 n=1 Tax=Hevea brasiliensis TaxID=3981 RepID=UPI002600BF92|nr:uncharacterized protein LOC131172054 [Hevea brasiliensis]